MLIADADADADAVAGAGANSDADADADTDTDADADAARRIITQGCDARHLLGRERQHETHQAPLSLRADHPRSSSPSPRLPSPSSIHTLHLLAGHLYHLIRKLVSTITLDRHPMLSVF